MRLIGLMPVRNEEYVLGLSARVALLWCDALILGLHASTDASETIADQIIVSEGPGRIVVADLPGQEWKEMEHRQIMLDLARQEGATHIALIDADEVVTGNLIDPYNIREMIAVMPRGHIMQLPGYNLRRGIREFHANGIWGNRWFSVAFRDEPRLHWGGDQFHHREPMGGDLTVYRPIGQKQGGVMHLWGASERRLKAKHALFKVTERLRWPDKRVEEIDQMYSWAIHGEGTNRSYGSPETWVYAPVPDEWWRRYADWMRYLDVDAVPWQAAEVQSIIAEYGPEPFSKLDLFGVDRGQF